MILPFLAHPYPVKTREPWRFGPACSTAVSGSARSSSFGRNFVDAALVDIMGGYGYADLGSRCFFRMWQPKRIWALQETILLFPPNGSSLPVKSLYAWLPFLLLAAVVIIWGLPVVKAKLDAVTLSIPVPGLHQRVLACSTCCRNQHAEPAVFDIAWLSSAVGTPTFLGRPDLRTGVRPFTPPEPSMCSSAHATACVSR